MEELQGIKERNNLAVVLKYGRNVTSASAGRTLEPYSVHSWPSFVDVFHVGAMIDNLAKVT